MMIEQLIQKLKEEHKIISVMESCTGGSFANMITNVEGASNVFQFGAVTYSNEYKIKMGVQREVIDTYTVYSKETAIAMARAIQEFTNSDYSVGITGKLGVPDPNNVEGEDHQVFFCIYDKEKDQEHTFEMSIIEKTRDESKKNIIKKIAQELLHVIIEREE